MEEENSIAIIFSLCGLGLVYGIYNMIKVLTVSPMVINQKHPSSPKNAATTGSISCSVTVHISADENVFHFFYESSYVKRENHVSLFIAKILNFNILLTVQFYF